jgi:preprotein translocase subunit SecB
MTDQTAPQLAGAENAPQAQFTVEKIYVKDVSFEAPNAPQIFQEQGQPQIQLNLAQKVNKYDENGLYEVVLTVTVTCKIADKTAYLAEVQQAGVFGLTGFDSENLEAVLGTYCPHTLYPYARQAIADLVMQGGFPPFVLQPINFEQLYTEHRKRSGTQPAVANA